MVAHAGSTEEIVHADMTLTPSKVKVKGLLNFQKLAKPCMLAAMTVSPLVGTSGRPTFVVLWPNGWVEQDATWYRGRPRLRPRCVIWGPTHLPTS